MEYVTPSVAANRIGVDRRTIGLWAKSGRIDAIRVSMGERGDMFAIPELAIENELLRRELAKGAA